MSRNEFIAVLVEALNGAGFECSSDSEYITIDNGIKRVSFSLYDTCCAVNLRILLNEETLWCTQIFVYYDETCNVRVSKDTGTLFVSLNGEASFATVDLGGVPEAGQY